MNNHSKPMNTHISIKTEDNAEIKVNSSIKKISQLFANLFEDYDMSRSKEKMDKMYSKDLKLLIEFCEMCNYEPVEFQKPLWKYTVSYNVAFLNHRLRAFYNELTQERMLLYMNISDFYTVASIDEIIYLKLHDVLTSTDERVKEYFKLDQDKDIAVPPAQFNGLYEKYAYYYKNDIKDKTDEEIEALCEKFL